MPFSHLREKGKHALSSFFDTPMNLWYYDFRINSGRFKNRKMFRTLAH